MSTIQATPPVLADRRGGLIFFGIVQILLGCLAFLMVLLMLISHAITRHMSGVPHNPVRFLGHGIFIYVATGACLLVLGIGSTQCRRWAQALTLVINWIVMLAGVVATLVMAVFFPRLMMMVSARDAHPIPHGMMLFMSVFVIGILAFFTVLMPLIFVIFYSRGSVRATCERRDSVTRWTDPVPLMVLALVVIYIWAAFNAVAQAVFIPVVPVFGIYVSGPAGAAICLALSAILVLLTFGIYRREMRAWWAALALKVIAVVSCVTTFAHSNLADLYSRMGVSGPGIDLVIAHGQKFQRLMTMGVIGVSVAGMVYLLIVRHYFSAPAPLPPAEPAA